jgi:hypothetical protein
MKKEIKMDLNSLVGILIFIFGLSHAQAATLVKNYNFESGNLIGLRCSGNCPSVNSAAKFTGNYGSDFILTRSMNVKKRTEIEMTPNFEFDKEYWIGYNMKFNDWAPDSDTDMAMQVHPAYQDWSWVKDCPIGNGYKADGMNFSIKNDVIRLVTWGGFTRWQVPMKHKQWQAVVFRVVFSGGSNGLIEAWIDGEKIVSVKGQNIHVTDSCGHPMAAPYLKLGIYKWTWDYQSTQSSRREMFIDNIKIASGSDGYSVVNPTTVIQQDSTPPAISNIQVAVTDYAATITWNTNETSDSEIKYGTTSSYGATIQSGSFVTSHKMTLMNLKSNSLYHYKVSSSDSSGNTGSSSDLTLTTHRALSDDLVADWPMDYNTGVTVPDVSGNGHTGTLVNGAILTSSNGVKFDGIDDYLNVGKFDVVGSSITIAARAISSSLSNCKANSCRIISKALSTNEQDHYFAISTILVGSSTRLRFMLKLGGFTSTLIATSGDLSNNVAFHVTATYDGSIMRLYKDGVEVGRLTRAGSLTDNSYVPVWIGGNPSGATSRPWKGHIDNVIIYKYPLTNLEINSLVND